MKKVLISTMLLAGMLTACNDEAVNPIDGQEPAQVKDEVYSVTLVDADGHELTELSGDFTEAYVDIVADGEWFLSTEESNFVYLTTQAGSGNARVPVMLSTCWAEERTFSIQATPASEIRNGAIVKRNATRGDGEGTSTASTTTITQSNKFDKATIKQRLSSNLGAGYSVTIATTNNILLKTQLQLFNMNALEKLSQDSNVILIDDDYTPQMEQKYVESNSYTALRDQVTVGIKGNIASGSLEGSNLSGNVDVRDNTDSSSYYGARRQITKFFTRTIDYASINALDKGSKALAPGFRMMRDSLQAQLLRHIQGEGKTHRDTIVGYQLVDAFIREVGPNFISKASMGCALDYYIKIDTSDMQKGVNVKAVLDVKYESQVKDTAKTVIDSTAFTANADVTVLEGARKAASKSEIEVVVNGGDVSKVDVLCNGGTLTTTDIQAWQGSISPESAVMIEMEIVPISALFNNEDAKLFIYNYLVAQGLTERYADQVLKNK